MSFPIPHNEAERLRELESLELVDTKSPAELQLICEVAASITGSPVALMSLVTSDEQIFVANVGLEATRRTPRDIAFCGHAIMNSDSFIVADATRDPRFCENPLVTGAPFIRSYAGIPLSTAPNTYIGTLCTLDYAPRALAAKKIADLRSLGHITEKILKANRLQGAQAREIEFLTRNAESSGHTARLRQETIAALARGEFVPYFQPLIHLGSGQLVGFEALARRLRPTVGIEAPAAFNAALNDRVVGPLVTDAIISAGILSLSKWKHNGLAAGRVAFNVTTFDLENLAFVPSLLRKLDIACVEPSDIAIEITEAVIMGEVNGQVHVSVRDLRSFGVQVALDDFGTGFAGLQHLREWPIDRIKIDKTFVDQCLIRQSDEIILRAIITLAHDLGQTVVAEGIETIEQLAFLSNIGCDVGQGYVWEQPMSEDNATRFIRGSQIDRSLVFMSGMNWQDRTKSVA